MGILNMDVYRANLCQSSYSNSNINNSIFISDKETDCQCYITYNGANVFITFRGTTSIEDWKHNINTKTENVFSDLKVHKGFLDQYMSVRNKIYTAIPNIHSENIFISGHSLGGALAYVCAVDIMSTTNNKNIKVFTIGSPRPGNNAFAEYFINNVKESKRYKNKGDIITKLPLRSKFKHVQPSISLENGVNVKDKKLYNTIVPRLTDICCTCICNITNLTDKHSVDLYIDNIQKYNK
jgi:hypothetical protein